MGYQTNLKKKVDWLKEQLSKTSTWTPVTLCVFVLVCYGIYLLQSFRSALVFASMYARYIGVRQVVTSLYQFGKVGLIVYTFVESGILLSYLKGRMTHLRQFMGLQALVLISNLAIYFFISYLYEYTTLITW